MKKRILILGICLATLTGFTTSVKDAGNSICKAFIPLKKGTTLTYENYNAKDKLISSEHLTVKDVVETANQVLIKMHMASIDKKGKEASEAEFDYICEGNSFKMSMESMLDQQMMEAYKDMEVEVTQTNLVMPADMVPGTELPDAELTMNVSSGGMQIMTINFQIVDRKVEAIETMETPAGSFECFKLSQSTKMKMAFMNKTYKSVDWISENVGSVRSESYNEKGSLESYRILTEIKSE